ncbi:hypothetical protein Ciccas_012418 [Cichlidogyrus casuarinus]|uniref:Uncharacterized protein n=1 Tax=Cichlidogyrus casuarinus TaxID=1844966 RepID=A0ABD2PPE2_9PLAT
MAMQFCIYSIVFMLTMTMCVTEDRSPEVIESCDETAEGYMQQSLMEHWYKRDWSKTKHLFARLSLYQDMTLYKAYVCPLLSYYFDMQKLERDSIPSLYLPDGMVNYVFPSFLTCRCPKWHQVRVNWSRQNTNRTPNKICIHATTKDLHLQNVTSDELEGVWTMALDPLYTKKHRCEIPNLFQVKKGENPNQNLTTELDNLFQQIQPSLVTAKTSIANDTLNKCREELHQLSREPHKFFFINPGDDHKVNVYFRIPMCQEHLDKFSWQFLARDEGIEDPFHYVDGVWSLSDAAAAATNRPLEGLESSCSNYSCTLSTRQGSSFKAHNVMGTYFLSTETKKPVPIYFHLDMLEYPIPRAASDPNWDLEINKDEPVVETFGHARLHVDYRMRDLFKNMHTTFFYHENTSYLLNGTVIFSNSFQVADKNVCGTLTYSIGWMCVVKHGIVEHYPEASTQSNRLIRILAILKNSVKFQLAITEMFGHVKRGHNAVYVPCHCSLFRHYARLLKVDNLKNRIELSRIHVLCPMKNDVGEFRMWQEQHRDRLSPSRKLGFIETVKVVVRVLNEQAKYTLKCPTQLVREYTGNQSIECNQLLWRESVVIGYYHPIEAEDSHCQVNDQCDLVVSNDGINRTFACYFYNEQWYPNQYMLGVFVLQVENDWKGSRNHNLVALGSIIVFLFFLFVCFLGLLYAFSYDCYLTSLEQYLE